MWFMVFIMETLPRKLIEMGKVKLFVFTISSSNLKVHSIKRVGHIQQCYLQCLRYAADGKYRCVHIISVVGNISW